jgi:phosphomannomutase
MQDLLARLRQKVVVGIVGGSDLVKQREQMGEDVTDRVDYSFSGYMSSCTKMSYNTAFTM